MIYTIPPDRLTSVLPIPAETAEHLKLTGGLPFKVLIYIISALGEDKDTESIAKALGESPDDVKDALDYWTNAGILAGANTPHSTAAAVKSTVPSAARTAIPTKTTALSPNIKVVSSLPVRMTPSEMEEYMSLHSETRVLLDQAQGILKKEFTPSEACIMLSIYAWADVPMEVILMVCEYCAGEDRRSLRYIESTVIGFLKEGIDTFEKAEEYIISQSRRRDRENELKNMLGIYGRRLTSKELGFSDMWAEWDTPMPLIQAAYEKAVISTGKASFSYMHKVLEAWHNAGIKTIEEVGREEASFKSKKKKQESSFDMQSFDRMMIEGTPKL